MKIHLFLLGLIVSTVTSETNVEDVLKNGNNQFTANFFNEVSKEQAGRSFIISAYSVLSPLAQLALASVGHSHDEILTAIGMPDNNVTKEVFAYENNRVRSINGVELKQANKVYVRDGANLDKTFAAISRSVFNSDVQNINFGNSEAAAHEINAWVEENTNNRIKDLVDSNSISAATAVVLVNALFFKAKWASSFPLYTTEDRDFHVTRNEKITVRMMNQGHKFKYDDNKELDATLLEMPYIGDETSFVVVLPKQKDGVESLIEKLKGPAAFPKARSTMHLEDVKVSLPKFKIETKTDLKELLQKINIEDLFTVGKAHLDNLIEGESDLYVSGAIQKAFIEVDELGTEAAAANFFGAVGSSLVIDPPTYKIFNADHPFVFYLMYHDNIIFNGVFRS